MDERIIPAGWPAPANVHACVTTRNGGVSDGPYASFNLALHVNDDPERVARNRSMLANILDLPSEPTWLEQVHGTNIIHPEEQGSGVRADGSFTQMPGKVCVVMTADCLPVLLCNRSGTAVAALHAGWRSLAGGILEKGVEKMPDGNDILAWLGPAIGPDRFEVGEEVIEQLGSEPGKENDWCKKTDVPGKWLVDIYSLARKRLLSVGVTEVSGGGLCTVTDDRHFYSYRRQGACGRMASLIWMDPLV